MPKRYLNLSVDITVVVVVAVVVVVVVAAVETELRHIHNSSQCYYHTRIGLVVGWKALTK